MAQTETPNELATRLRVLGLHQAGFAVPALTKKMKAEGFSISRTDVVKILAAASNPSK